MKNQESDPRLLELLRRMKPVSLSGAVSAPQLLLTPPDVKKVNADRHSIRKPGAFQPRTETRFNPATNAVRFFRHFEADSEESEEKSVGLYQGGIIFPPHCCVCMKPAARHEVIELAVHKRYAGKIGIQDVSQEEADLIGTALSCDRYWYIVPFCGEHDLQSRGVNFRDDVKHLVFEFTNREYGKLFGRINGLETRWLDKSVMQARALSKTGLIIGILCILASLAAIYLGGGPTPGRIMLASAGAIITVWSLAYRSGRVKGKTIDTGN